MKSSSKVIIGMSGGVDSAVAAMRLIEQGYRVEGLFMKNWEEDDSDDYCAAAEDLADAQGVCNTLQIPLSTVNFSGEYWDRVFRYFVHEYERGRTPNPDILCNSEIKFRAFLDHARGLGADCIATGHYARRVDGENGPELHRCADENKDQTYFLHLLTQQQLAASLFPLYDLQKNDVRKIAETAGLPNFKKKDSTGICFIGERRFSDFLKQYVPARPGEIVTDQGEMIGKHNGVMFYTYGQRKGLGIGGVANRDESPWFVVDKDLANNRLIVAQNHEHPMLMKTTLLSGIPHWIGGNQPADVKLDARIRHRQPLQACAIRKQDNGQLRVDFELPQRAVTPGQSIVFYHGKHCLGGAVIEQ